MLRILGSSSTIRTRVVRSALSATRDTAATILRFGPPCPSGSELALFEGEGEVGPWQLIRPTNPARPAPTVLGKEAATAGLLLQILRQIRRVRPEHDLLQVIGQQQRLGADALPVVEDHPLETLVDEIGVGGIWLRPRNRRAEHFQAAAGQERLIEVHRLSAELIRRDRLNERQDI